MNKTPESMPSEQRRALADLCRFERLKHYDAGYAASEHHLPDLAHSQAVMETLSRAGLAVLEKRPGGDAVVTPHGRHRLDEINAERIGAAT